MAISPFDSRRTAAATPRATEPRRQSPEATHSAGLKKSWSAGNLGMDVFQAARPNGGVLPDLKGGEKPDFQRNVGGVNVTASGPSFDVKADANADVSLKGVDIDVVVDIDATLAEAGATGSRTIALEIAGEKYEVQMDFEALGKIGAQGKLNLDIHIGTNGQIELKAKADGFAGARASLTGSIELRHEGEFLARGEVTASAVAGVSGNAHVDAGFKNGNVYFDAGAEATAGVGFGVEVHGEANVPNIIEAAGETALGVGREGVENVVDKISDKVHDIFH